jgi:hypothetical protein
MSIKNRIVKLEEAAGVNQVNKYMVVTGGAFPTNDGYKIQPFVKEQGGTGEDAFYLATWEEVQDFAARPDVDLTVIEICYTDMKGEKGNGQD